MTTPTAVSGSRFTARPLAWLCSLVLLLTPVPLRSVAPDRARHIQATPAPLGPVTMLAAGAHHTCALTTDRGVLCWGRNSQGQLGDGTTIQRTVPTPVQGLPGDVVALTAGAGHTCALLIGGVLCWGANADGELGDGTTIQRLTPTPVQGLPSQVQAISAGARHTCARTHTSAVLCWGRNSNGQLGDGTTSSRSTPVAVSGLLDGGAVTAGGFHTCARTGGDRMKCWGRNGGGQLGDGTTTQRLTPVQVYGLRSTVAEIGAGVSHSCARRWTGGLQCWGYNDYGQIGDGTATSRLRPVVVGGLQGEVQAIAGGGNHSCVLTVAGAVQCWGNNFAGQVGDGTRTRRTTPVAVGGLGSGIAAVATGFDHSCALTTAGAVLCWGLNASGQLGDGTTTDRATPMYISGRYPTITAVAAGAGHSCAVTATGGVKCWGSNSHGKLGDGTRSSRLVPVDVVGLQTGIAAIVASAEHTCALTTQGGVLCWGGNAYAQLGDGTKTDRWTPVSVSGLSRGVAAISAGNYHTCALTTAGGVKCWGINANGRLGDGTQIARSTPVDVAGLQSGVAAIGAGSLHTCAVTTQGGAKCWGQNVYAQLGDGTKTDRWTPVDVAGLAGGVTAISGGDSHSCALTTAGGAKCWGSNDRGMLGDGTGEMERLTPVDVVGLASGVTAIRAGPLPTCAVTTEGGAKCWGGNAYAQLGDGTTTDRWTPVDVVGLHRGVTAIAVGWYHTCAAIATGGVKCWGGNYLGQLGDGTTADRLAPVDVRF